LIKSERYTEINKLINFKGFERNQRTTKAMRPKSLSAITCLCILHLCLYTPHLSIAQPSAAPDSSAVNSMLDAATALEIENPDSALAIYQEVISLSKSIPYIVARGRSRLYSGIVHSDQGRYDEAIASYLKSIEVFEEAGYDEGIGSAFVNLGNIENRKAQYGKAIAYYLDGIRIFESLGDTARLIYAYANVGAVLSDVQQFDKSLIYSKKSMALSRSVGDSLGLCDAMVNIGLVYIRTNQLDSAKAIYDAASQIAQAYNDAQLLYLINNNRSTVFSKEEQHEKALSYAKKSLKYAEILNNPVYVSNAHGAIGQAYYNLGNPDSAKYYIAMVLQLVENDGSVETYMMGLEKMAMLEDAAGNAEAALGYLKRLKILEEEDARLRQKKVIAGLEIAYESEKKDLAISEKNAELERNQAILAKRNYLIAGLLSALVFTILIFALIRRSLRQKRKIAEQDASLNKAKLIKLAKQKEVDNLRAMLEGEDKERSRLAKDLHDGLGGMLSATKLRFSNIQLRHREFNGSADYAEALALIDKTSVEARRISHNLMPGALEKFGLKEALNDFCQNIEASSSIAISLQVPDILKMDDPRSERNIYRIIQELINNVVKHADATEIIVQLMQIDSHLHTTVEDNGTGFNPVEMVDGLGMRSIRSRINLLKGNLIIESNISEGSSFQFAIPVNERK